MDHILLGKQAPQIVTTATGVGLEGEKQQFELEQHKGKWIVLFFYPKDDTPGCTHEAKSFNMLLKKFNVLNVDVIGISKDTFPSHVRFKEKYDLHIQLLVDKNKEIAEAYHNLKEKKFMGRPYLGVVRSTFLINPEGKVDMVWFDVNPEEHAKEVYTYCMEHKKISK